MDLFHTFSKIAGIPLPDDRILDSHDLSPLLFEKEKTSREQLFYYRGTQLYAVRYGAYKAHFITQGEYGQFGGKEEHNPPLLYNLNHDPSEQFDIAEAHPEILKKIEAPISITAFVTTDAEGDLRQPIVNFLTPYQLEKNNLHNVGISFLSNHPHRI